MTLSVIGRIEWMFFFFSWFDFQFYIAFEWFRAIFKRQIVSYVNEQNFLCLLRFSVRRVCLALWIQLKWEIERNQPSERSECTPRITHLFASFCFFSAESNASAWKILKKINLRICNRFNSVCVRLCAFAVLCVGIRFNNSINNDNDYNRNGVHEWMCLCLCMRMCVGY